MSDETTLNLELNDELRVYIKDELRKKLQSMLDGDSGDDEMLEYIMLLVSNNRSKAHIANDLDTFFGGEEAREFAEWLWDLLLPLANGGDMKVSSEPEAIPALEHPSDPPSATSSMQLERGSQKPRGRASGHPGARSIPSVDDEDDSYNRSDSFRAESRSRHGHHDQQQHGRRDDDRRRGGGRDKTDGMTNAFRRAVTDSASSRGVDVRKRAGGHHRDDDVPQVRKVVKRSDGRTIVVKKRTEPDHSSSGSGAPDLRADHRNTGRPIPSVGDDMGNGDVDFEASKSNIVVRRRAEDVLRKTIVVEKKAAQPAPTSTAPSGKKIKCRFFPNCTNGAKCPFYHPTQLCKFFPNCSFGDACLNIHLPQPRKVPCKFGFKCTNASCTFQHPPGFKKKNPFSRDGASADSATTVCRFDPNCNTITCRFTHPEREKREAAFFGGSSQQEDKNESADVESLSNTLPGTPPHLQSAGDEAAPVSEPVASE